MADLDDVCNVLVGMAAGLVYPNGISQPSVTGNTVRVFQGWPVSQQLDADLAAGICNVSVFPPPQEKNTTRYPKEWEDISQNVATLALTINGQSVVVSGNIPTAGNPQNVMVGANRSPYVYAVQPTDTLASIAAHLAAIIAVGIPGTASAGPVINFPANALIAVARVGVTGLAAMEVRRQEQLIQIGIWASTPDQRTTIAKAIDPTFAATDRILMPDQYLARLLYRNTFQRDEMQKQMIYRRDLFYTVEYATTLSDTTYTITQIGVNLTGSP